MLLVLLHWQNVYAVYTLIWLYDGKHMTGEDAKITVMILKEAV